MLVALLSVFVNLRICNDSVVIIKRPYLAVLTKKYDTDLESAKKNVVVKYDKIRLSLRLFDRFKYSSSILVVAVLADSDI